MSASQNLSEYEQIAGCVCFAAVAAAFAGAAPTGTTWWDPLLRAALAGVFVRAAASASWKPLIVAATVAMLGVGTIVWLAVAFLGFALGCVGLIRRDHQPLYRAGAAAFTFQALLHLRPVGFFGLPSLIAGACMVVVLVSGYRAATPATRRRVRRIVGGLAAAATLGIVMASLFALPVRGTADEGIAAARLGLEAARAGDTSAVPAHLDVAAAQLGEVAAALDRIAFKPLTLIPVAAQHYRSVSVAADQGSSVASMAAAAAQDADVDRLQLRQGQFDLDLLAAMAPQLERTATAVENALHAIEGSRSPWLIPPIDDELGSLTDELASVLPEARLSADAAQILPGLLGAERERRYLMLFGSPGESREFGGFIGGYALISVSRGDLTLRDAGSINDLVDRSLNDRLDDPDEYPTEYVNVDPGMFPQNLTSSPNIEVIARGARDVFPELDGAPIDGIIYIDPYALGAMTDLTGPIVVEGLEQPLDRTTLPEFIFDGQYRQFDSRGERFDAIGAIARATAAGFEDADLPGPERLGEVLGPMARAGRLQVITYDDTENAFLASVLLQRNFVASNEFDSVAVIQTNGTPSKLDLYLHREIDYDVTVGQDGTLRATVDVRLHSDVPADAAPLTFGETDGTNQVLLSLYSRHELTNLNVDGKPHEFVVHEEFGFFRYALFKVPLAPNSSATVQFELVGVAAASPYRLAVWAQPLVNPDVVSVTYREPGQPPASQTRSLAENWLFDPGLPN